jgi:hypothetical protein
MNEKQRLNKWMAANGLNYRSLAEATGDTYSNIHMMTKGDRAVNDAFKFRFWRTFGQEATILVFGEKVIDTELEPTP